MSVDSSQPLPFVFNAPFAISHEDPRYSPAFVNSLRSQPDNAGPSIQTAILGEDAQSTNGFLRFDSKESRVAAAGSERRALGDSLRPIRCLGCVKHNAFCHHAAVNSKKGKKETETCARCQARQVKCLPVQTTHPPELMERSLLPPDEAWGKVAGPYLCPTQHARRKTRKERVHHITSHDRGAAISATAKADGVASMAPVEAEEPRQPADRPPNGYAPLISGGPRLTTPHSNFLWRPSLFADARRRPSDPPPDGHADHGVQRGQLCTQVIPRPEVGAPSCGLLGLRPSGRPTPDDPVGGHSPSRLSTDAAPSHPPVLDPREDTTYITLRNDSHLSPVFPLARSNGLQRTAYSPSPGPVEEATELSTLRVNPAIQATDLLAAPHCSFSPASEDDRPPPSLGGVDPLEDTARITPRDDSHHTPVSPLATSDRLQYTVHSSPPGPVEEATELSTLRVDPRHRLARHPHRSSSPQSEDDRPSPSLDDVTASQSPSRELSPGFRSATLTQLRIAFDALPNNHEDPETDAYLHRVRLEKDRDFYEKRLGEEMLEYEARLERDRASDVQYQADEETKDVIQLKHLLRFRRTRASLLAGIQDLMTQQLPLRKRADGTNLPFHQCLSQSGL